MHVGTNEEAKDSRPGAMWKELKKAAPPEPKKPVIPKPPPSRRPPIQEEIF